MREKIIDHVAMYDKAKRVAEKNDGRHGDPLHSPYQWQTAEELARHYIDLSDRIAALVEQQRSKPRS